MIYFSFIFDFKKPVKMMNFSWKKKGPEYSWNKTKKMCSIIFIDINIILMNIVKKTNKSWEKLPNCWNKKQLHVAPKKIRDQNEVGPPFFLERITFFFWEILYLSKKAKIKNNCEFCRIFRQKSEFTLLNEILEKTQKKNATKKRQFRFSTVFQRMRSTYIQEKLIWERNFFLFFHFHYGKFTLKLFFFGQNHDPPNWRASYIYIWILNN